MEESIETMYEMVSIAYTEECKRNAKLKLAFDILNTECTRLKNELRRFCYCEKLHPDTGGKCDACLALESNTHQTDTKS